jgi:hypothetical protein
MPDFDAPDLPTTRRTFLRRGALATLAIPAGISALESCSPGEPRPAAAAAPPAPPAGHAPAPAPAAVSAATRSENMDAMHEAGVKAFPAKSAGQGNVLLAPKLDRGVKEYELT